MYNNFTEVWVGLEFKRIQLFVTTYVEGSFKHWFYEVNMNIRVEGHSWVIFSMYSFYSRLCYGYTYTNCTLKSILFSLYILTNILIKR